MRIVDLLSKEKILLHTSAADKNAAIDLMVGLQEKGGALTDKEAYKQAILAREAQSSTAIEAGIAVPHAKAGCVREPSLAAVTLDRGVDYGAMDGQPSDLFFMIAAPMDGNVHLEILSHLMVLLMDPAFSAELRAAGDADAFLAVIDRYEQAKYGAQEAAAPAEPVKESLPAEKSGYRILAVTACPTGIAHTYMAAEALEKAGQKLGLPLKAETNGSGGAKNVLTPEEIEAADGIIIAADKNVETARFSGKRVLFVPVSDGIHKPEALIQRIESGNVPVYKHEGAAESSAATKNESAGRQIYKHLMNGVSHMLPFVVAGGVMLALSLLLQHLFGRSDITTMMTNVGNAAFRMMYPVLAAFIAYSIADRPGFMPGLMGGYLAQLGTTTAPRLGWISSGFWGAIVAGFAAGLAVRLLNYLFRRIPQELDHIKTGLLVPLLSLLFVGALMVMAINPPLGRFNAWLSIQLDGMQGGSRLVLGTLLGGMMATDYGGPINKAAYVSGTLALVDQQYDLMAAVMAGGMIPPLGIGLACLLFPTRFTSTERCSAPQTLLMGATFVTEGALPFALRDPLRVSLACIAGSALAGFITILLGCGCPAPHGGLFLLPVMENPPGFLIALAVGTLTTALLLGMLKKPLKH